MVAQPDSRTTPVAAMAAAIRNFIFVLSGAFQAAAKDR